MRAANYVIIVGIMLLPASKLFSYITLKRSNNFLAVLVCILAAYIVLMPFLPEINWWIKHESPLVSTAPATTPPENKPDENSLVIPSLDLVEKIHEGQSSQTLSHGIWLRPQGSTPDKNSNTVLAGHRFTYSGQAVFYHLDKVNMGDPVYLYWNDERYEYKVSNISIVPPTQASIEEPSPTAKLTIYTCTPLWSAKDRLIIEAELVEPS